MNYTAKYIWRFQARQQSTLPRKDFFGIADITTKDVSGIASAAKLPKERLDEKYSPLTTPRGQLANEEVKKVKTFGQVRYDHQNIPKTHGQFDKKNDRPQYETSEITRIFHNEPESLSEHQKELKPLEQTADPRYGTGLTISQVRPEKNLDQVLREFKDKRSETKAVGAYQNQPPIKFFFKFASKSVASEESDVKSSYIDLSPTKLKGGPESTDFPIRSAKTKLEFDSKKSIEAEKDRIAEEREQIEVEESKLRSSSNSEKLRANDYLKKVAKHEIKPKTKKFAEKLENRNLHPLKPVIKLDSMGFRNYTHQVPDWSAMRHVEILQAVKDSIIYNNYDILAVNKPYGIPSHEREREREPIDMNSLMHELAKGMNLNKLYLAHRLDKTTTGVLLFATSYERAKNLNKLFKSDQIKKTYLCITKSVPKEPAAIIDIPIAIFKVDGKLRSCLAPANVEAKQQLSKKYLEARRAITEYETVSTGSGCALLEAKPRTGVKHQIRCHLGFGIRCPILGDHKYSHIDKIAPQLLSQPTLNKLRLRQPKVRTLPTHLHAKSVVIPGAKANGETLFISAPLPPHFSHNMSSLGLKIPNE